MPFDQQQFEIAPVIVRSPVPKCDPVLLLLEQARAWLSDPRRWIKGEMVKNGATCALGALGMEQARAAGPLASAALMALARSLPWGLCVASYNDDPTTTHADVLALYDRAITARARTIPPG